MTSEQHMGTMDYGMPVSSTKRGEEKNWTGRSRECCSWWEL